MSQSDAESLDTTVVTHERVGLSSVADAQKGAASSGSDLVGSTFAQKYEILQLLGKGGMSVVYRARHIVMNKTHAIKILHCHLAADSTSLRRFTQEAKAASNLNHPNIVTVHDCGEGDGVPYLVMDLVEGKTLAELLKEEGPLPAARFLTIMQQVCSALTHAHERGIIHRDLKPSNIMITEQNQREQVKIVDFGIAKVISESPEGAQAMTQTGDVVGSPLYMSPEQCSGSTLDRRTDIYSLGCVMYELLTGEAPHRGANVLETIYKHVNVSPDPLKAPQLDAESKQKLEVLLLRCLAKLPEDRFQSMEEVERELRSLSLQNKTGLFRALGGAWDLAAAKRRATRQSRLPLLILILISSIVSIVVLSSGLQQADQEMAKLEQSRELVGKIADADAAFVLLAEKTREYVAAVMFHPNRIRKTKKGFDAASERIKTCLDQVDAALPNDDPVWAKYKNLMHRQLDRTPDEAAVSINEMQVVSSMGGMASLQNMATLDKLSDVCAVGEKVLQRMSAKARLIEDDALEQFKKAQVRIRFLSVGCSVWNGGIILALIAYIARDTQQRLKKLARSAELLSKKRGISRKGNDEDEATDLDVVLQDLASALSEAEEREKMLLAKLKKQSTSEGEATTVDVAKKETQMI